MSRRMQLNRSEIRNCYTVTHALTNIKLSEMSRENLYLVGKKNP